MFLYFLCFPKTKLKFLCNADVGRVQPVEEANHIANRLAERSVERAILKDLNTIETLTELWQHIDGLTFGILDFWIEGLPM